MTSILAGITNSSQSTTGIRAVVAGVEKIGKTTFATSAPRALLIPLETGYGGVVVQKTEMLTTFAQVMDLLGEIANTPSFPYKSLVWDSATALERLIHNAVLARDPNWSPGNKKTVTMDSALGGYGKGYQFANELFAKFLEACDWLAINRGINIILTCHVFAGKLIDPTVGEYDTWDLLLHSPKNQKAYGKREMLTQWADLIGFLHDPIYITKGDSVTQGMSANKGRVMGMSRTPGYVAGNRYGITGEIQIPVDKGWNQIAGAIHQSRGLDFFNRD
jgi:hypothetical protein